MKSPLLLIPLLLLCYGCDTQQTDAPEKLQQLMQVWQNGDTSILNELFTPEARYQDIPNGTELEGIEAIRAYVDHVHAWADQISIEVTHLQGDNQHASAQWVMRGVQAQPIAGRIPIATQRPFTLQGLTLIELEKGKIKRAADYMDVLGLVLQLGARVELPGGVVLQDARAQEGLAPSLPSS